MEVEFSSGEDDTKHVKGKAEEPEGKSGRPDFPFQEQNESANKLRTEIFENYHNEFNEKADCAEKFLVTLIYQTTLIENSLLEELKKEDYIKGLPGVFKKFEQCMEAEFKTWGIKLEANFIEKFIDNKKFTDLRNTFCKILREIQPLNIRELKRLLNKSMNVKSIIKGKDLVWILGNTGCGKSLYLHYIAGSEFKFVSEEDIQPVSNKKLPFLLELVKTKKQFVSVTKYLTPIEINVECGAKEVTIVICESPGFYETEGIEYEIANTLGATEAMKEANSVKPIFLFSKDHRGPRSKNFVEDLELISRIFTDLDTAKKSFSYVFNFYKQTNKETFKKDLRELYATLIEKGRKFDAFSELINDIIIKTDSDRKIEMFNPLDGKGAERLIDIIYDKDQFIKNPNHAFQPFFTKDNLAIIESQIIIYEKSISNAFENNNIDYVNLKLSEILDFWNVFKLNRELKKKIFNLLSRFFEAILGNHKNACSFLAKGLECGNIISKDDISTFNLAIVKLEKLKLGLSYFEPIIPDYSNLKELSSEPIRIIQKKYSEIEKLDLFEDSEILREFLLKMELLAGDFELAGSILSHFKKKIRETLDICCSNKQFEENPITNLKKINDMRNNYIKQLPILDQEFSKKTKAFFELIQRLEKELERNLETSEKVKHPEIINDVFEKLFRIKEELKGNNNFISTKEIDEVWGNCLKVIEKKIEILKEAIMKSIYKAEKDYYFSSIEDPFSKMYFLMLFPQSRTKSTTLVYLNIMERLRNKLEISLKKLKSVINIFQTDEEVSIDFTGLDESLRTYDTLNWLQNYKILDYSEIKFDSSLKDKVQGLLKDHLNQLSIAIDRINISLLDSDFKENIESIDKISKKLVKIKELGSYFPELLKNIESQNFSIEKKLLQEEFYIEKMYNQTNLDALKEIIPQLNDLKTIDISKPMSLRLLCKIKSFLKKYHGNILVEAEKNFQELCQFLSSGSNETINEGNISIVDTYVKNVQQIKSFLDSFHSSLELKESEKNINWAEKFKKLALILDSELDKYSKMNAFEIFDFKLSLCHNLKWLDINSNIFIDLYRRYSDIFLNELKELKNNIESLFETRNFFVFNLHYESIKNLDDPYAQKQIKSINTYILSNFEYEGILLMEKLSQINILEGETIKSAVSGLNKLKMFENLQCFDQKHVQYYFQNAYKEIHNALKQQKLLFFSKLVRIVPSNFSKYLCHLFENTRGANNSIIQGYLQDVQASIIEELGKFSLKYVKLESLKLYNPKKYLECFENFVELDLLVNDINDKVEGILSQEFSRIINDPLLNSRKKKLENMQNYLSLCPTKLENEYSDKILLEKEKISQEQNSINIKIEEYCKELDLENLKVLYNTETQGDDVKSKIIAQIEYYSNQILNKIPEKLEALESFKNVENLLKIKLYFSFFNQEKSQLLNSLIFKLENVSIKYLEKIEDMVSDFDKINFKFNRKKFIKEVNQNFDFIFGKFLKIDQKIINSIFNDFEQRFEKFSKMFEKKYKELETLSANIFMPNEEINLENFKKLNKLLIVWDCFLKTELNASKILNNLKAEFSVDSGIEKLSKILEGTIIKIEMADFLSRQRSLNELLEVHKQVKVHKGILKNFSEDDSLKDYFSEGKYIEIKAKCKSAIKTCEENYQKLITELEILIKKFEYEEKVLKKIDFIYNNLQILDQLKMLKKESWKDIEINFDSRLQKLKEKADYDNPENFTGILLELKTVECNCEWKKERAQNIINSLLCSGKDKRGPAFINQLAINLEKSELGRKITDDHHEFKASKLAIFNKKTLGHDINYALNNIKGTSIDKTRLKEMYAIFKDIYEKTSIKHVNNYKDLSHLEGEIKPFFSERDLVHTSSGLIRLSSKQIEQIPKLTALISAYWSISYTGVYYFENSYDSNKTQYMSHPHPSQVLTIFRILGIGDFDSENIVSNLVEVFTGEGKSLILAVVSIILSLYGFEVNCVCYSEYLSKRDSEYFAPLFKKLDVEKYITYSTLKELCNQSINLKGDVRKIVSNIILKEDKNNIYPLSNSSNRPKILLIDEVDVFFGDQFFGRSYNPISSINHPKIKALFDLIWQNRHLDKKDIKQKIMNSRIFKEVADLLEEYNFLMDNFIGSLLYDLKKYKDSATHSYEFIDGKVGYKDLDGISFSTCYQYKTAWAYYHENELMPGGVSKEKMAEIASLNIMMGSYYYENILSRFKFVVGVTGTLKSLTDVEKGLIKKYGIENETYMPSIYGISKRIFLKSLGKDMFIVDEQEYALKISQEIDKYKERAVLVFFENEAEINNFLKNTRLNKDDSSKITVLSEKDDFSGKSNKIQKGCNKGQITLCPKVFGRGSDFISRDENVNRNGGVHVIQTFFSDSVSEETQIIGRVARQGEPGSVSLVLEKMALMKKLDINQDELDNNIRGDIYGFLDKKRNEAISKHFADKELKRKSNVHLHKETEKFFKALIEMDTHTIKKKIMEFNNSK